MNLFQFIDYLQDQEKLASFLEVNYPNLDYYDIEIYLKNSLTINSELKFFDDNEIDGRIIMELDGVNYHNLFSLDYLVEVCNDYSKITDNKTDLAESILNYRINDA
ncbi:hypothetical protein [Sediminitomix flava]|uniref:Uncharacterized protein n=1 Tax=Sediminitomix flava TaxID=379075 RepID=A0A315YXB3_SEDFL|nr:hypothetical protein [Sediminitomix flava]PWJ32904.1 hypothetical protein BC781_1173 [Sediminitomix flava]